MSFSPWYLVHSWEDIKDLSCYSVLGLSTLKNVKCYPTMTKVPDPALQRHAHVRHDALVVELLVSRAQAHLVHCWDHIKNLDLHSLALLGLSTLNNVTCCPTMTKSHSCKCSWSCCPARPRSCCRPRRCGSGRWGAQPCQASPPSSPQSTSLGWPLYNPLKNIPEYASLT